MKEKNLSRGRLAQRESVRLQIQRSEFDSAWQQMNFSFASVADKYTQLGLIWKFLHSAKIKQRHLLEEKADFTLSL